MKWNKFFSTVGWFYFIAYSLVWTVGMFFINDPFPALNWSDLAFSFMVCGLGLVRASR